MPRSTTRHLHAAVAALCLALVAAWLVVDLRAAEAAPAARDTDATPTTWVVDAVDDARGNRWEAASTGTSTVRIAVGDSVEWRFGRAVIDHDLTSATASPTPWPTPVAVYRTPGGAPFSYTFDEPGTYSYLCSIHGTTMTGTVVVEEPGQVNQPPVADPMVSSLVGTAPLSVSVMAHASDPDGDPLAYLWDFGTGDEADRSPFEDASFVYTTPGFYTLSLQVADGRGGTFDRTWPVTVGGGGDAPTVAATAAPTSGPAPLPVAFSAQAHDAQGGPLTYAWDFGAPGTTDTAATPTAAWTYDAAGTYTATLTVTDAEGHVGVDTVEVVVGDAAGSGLPEVTAGAGRAGGRAVSFSTGVTTGGEVHAYSAGLTTYPDLGGTATMTRSRGATVTTLSVTGLKADAAHQVHVHERSCADERGGVHFRFDETQPFAEANEIWLYFTSDAGGASGELVTRSDRRAGAKAVAIVVHDPDNPAERIGCVDLVPTTADLTYAWDFGDGTTGSGPDPDKVYAADGHYTATVTVASSHAGHGMGLDGSVTDSVEVVVDTRAPTVRITGGPSGTVRSRTARFGLVASEPGTTLACRFDAGAWSRCGASTTLGRLRDGRHAVQVRGTDAAGNVGPVSTRSWTVDATGPTVRRAAGRATVVVRVTDRWSQIARGSLVVRVDGRRATPIRYDARTGRLTWSPRRPLTAGRHVVRVTAADAVGNRTVHRWTVTVRRR